ncbi:peptidylprolyl isomerase [Methylococcus mesophilus]|uniref:peptidylprolyl isomerase n=1 Tax=Methylococcus mesophilus TaxID=2993564 RepID=UPI00224AB7E8|nr:peptidylprolyl isomerase [Methylococcus mesophilus]UZR29542.1 peptidylprolyl isomerase [Methylococcus mesophilus]
MPNKTLVKAPALGRLLNEPLLQFFFLGAALFAVAHAVERHRANAAREIVIDPPLIERLSRLYELQTGSLPSQARMDKLVDEYVREEVLFREAVRMGLDRDDEIVRRRLTQKLDFLQRDLQAIADPTDSGLRQFYAEHPERFRVPATVSFSHVYFSPDRDGAEGARKRAEQALASLKTAGTERAPEAGDRFPLQYDFSGLSPDEAAQSFGRTPILDALFSAPPGQWTGPVESGYGLHLVYVSARKEPSVPPFDAIRDKVREAYLDAARREGNERRFEEMKRGYAVSYAGLEPTE